MTRERLYDAYINEVAFFNPELRVAEERGLLLKAKDIESFTDTKWIDIYYGPEIVGFMIVANGSHCPIDADYLVMELFVHADYRRKHLAFDTVKGYFNKHHGRAGLYLISKNAHALMFWEDVKKKLNLKTIKNEKASPFCDYHLFVV